MAERLSNIILCSNGYWPEVPVVGGRNVPQSIRDGRNIWVLPGGLLKSGKGLGTGTSGGGNVLWPVGSSIGAIGTGSVIAYRGSSYWYLGTGSVVVNGSVIGTASTTLKYTIGSSTYTAGLTAPSTGFSAEEGTTSSTIMKGSYSVVITRYNQNTGAESNGSEPSAVVSLNNKKLKVTFPAVEAGSGQTAWGVYFTFKGFGSAGPHYWFEDIAETTVAGLPGRAKEYEFYDSQLSSRTPPTDYFPPPTGTHVCAINNLMIVMGSYAGSGSIAAGISPSVPGKVEAFPPSYTVFLNPPENIQGFAQREGEVLIWTANTLQALVPTGSSSFPLLTRPVWGRTGILSPHGGCFADATFYAYTGQSSPARLGGEEPDTSFADPVREKMLSEGWNPSSVVVGWDPARDAVIYVGSGTSGVLAFPFMRGLGVWSTPFTMPGMPTAAITMNGQLYFSIGSALQTWQGGSGGTWYLQPAFQDEPQPSDRKTIIGYRAAGNFGGSALTAELLTDGGSSAVETQTSTASGQRYTPWKRINRKCKNYTVKLSGSGSGSQIDYIEVRYLYTDGVRID